MSAKLVELKRYLVGTLVMLIAIGGGSLLAADDAKSPSAEERRSVSALAEKGAVIFIDGDFQVTQIMGGRELSNEDLQHLRVFKKLRSLSLSNAKMNDNSVETLKSLASLQSLNLPTGAISDDSLQTLKKSLPNCRIVQPDRRGPDRTENSTAKTTNATSTIPGSRPAGSGVFEYPPPTPAPSISGEVRQPAVQERLKLSPEQQKEIDRVTGRDFQRQQSEDAIKKLLTAEQKTALQQVLLQREGPTALVLPEVAQKLKLNNDQKGAIQKMMDERRTQLMSVGDQFRNRTIDLAKSSQETQRIISEANTRLLSALTADQRKTWDSMIGPPLPINTRFGLTLSPAETARSIFRNLDRDSNGQLTSEEWHRSRNTRAKFENAKVNLEFPVAVDAFVKRYLQVEPNGPNRQ